MRRGKLLRMIDTHCHLTYKGLIEQVDSVIAAAKAAGVDRMISVGTSPDDARKAIDLANRYDNIFATVGIHPHYCDVYTNEAEVAETLRELSAHPRVVAIGEMGIDLHYDEPSLKTQQKVFAAQLNVAKELDKPIIIHNRKATEETLSLIAESQIPGERFVFHCFTGERWELDRILDLGAMVSFTGITTFKNASAIADCAAATPMDRLMIETDSPYLAPEPHRKVRPNEPKYVVEVAKFIAKRREMDYEAFVAQCDANADLFFRLPR